jgi:hypothetical protein
MKLFHGTNVAGANSIVGPPQAADVTKGGGELGRGFYTGDNLSLAVAWAAGRHGPSSAKVIEIDIDNSAYAALNIKIIQKWKHVFQFWRYLIKNSAVSTHLFGYDVVCAPFATISMSHQVKFESTAAEGVLNKKSTMQVL